MQIIKTEEFDSESLVMDVINNKNNGNISKFINNDECIESIINVININAGLLLLTFFSSLVSFAYFCFVF